MHRIHTIVRGACAATAAFSTTAASAQGQVRPLQYNADELVEMAVRGEISAPTLSDPPYRIHPDGTLGVYPGVGGITYNFRTGDSAVRIAADHVEPAVSVYCLGTDKSRTSGQNAAFNVLSCIGNEAVVVTGDAKGGRGWVIGKHGGAEHVMIDFPDDVYDGLAIGDHIQVRSVGTGMKLANLEGVAVMNMSPRLLGALTRAGLGVTRDGALRIGVTHRVPAKIMGSGLGRNHVFKGDYDIQLFDEQVVAEQGLETLRFGDIVAIVNADNTYGRIYKTGAISIGVVVHSRSWTAGHGPGVTTLFSSSTGNIETVIDPDANLGPLLGIHHRHAKVDTVERFRAARDAGDLEAARALLVASPRVWYEHRSGDGQPWTLGAGRWKQWDEHFDSVSHLGPWQVEGDTVWAIADETNDYYRLTERKDQSRYRLTYFFDAAGRIEGYMISAAYPDKAADTDHTRPASRAKEFAAWAAQHHPQEWAYLRPGGKLDPTGDRAPRTRVLLNTWRAEVGLPAIE